jgi:hypothetical protein
MLVLAPTRLSAFQGKDDWSNKDATHGEENVACRFHGTWPNHHSTNHCINELFVYPTAAISRGSEFAWATYTLKRRLIKLRKQPPTSK